MLLKQRATHSQRDKLGSDITELWRFDAVLHKHSMHLGNTIPAKLFVK